ncbi:MAG: pentapeptide repeat-containing protein [Planctomycetaceae bacterium]|nr:pentapeptide repeat-containing protein [Planctomycetaceae bacterium]
MDPACFRNSLPNANLHNANLHNANLHNANLPKRARFATEEIGDRNPQLPKHPKNEV